MEKKKLILYVVSIILALVCIIFIVRFATRILKKEENSANVNLELADLDEEDTISVEEDDSTNKHYDADKQDDYAGKQDDAEDMDQNNEKPEANDNLEIKDEFPEDSGEPQKDPIDGALVDIKEIDKPKHETDDITYGIDVAKWQGVIDWAKIKEAGVEFAMIRVGYRTLVDGKITEDIYAKYNLQQAEKHGVKIGVYFFSTAINEKEAKEEAKWVASYIAPYKITYPVAYNCEGFTDGNNRQNGMTKDERTKLAVKFLDYIDDKGYIPMFYAAKNELDNSRDWDTEKLAKKYKIWLAHYPNTIDQSNMKSSYSSTHDMWQYTSNGSVPGIKGVVDFNIAYFGFEKVTDAKEDISEKEVIADPAALIIFEEVNEEVTAKEVTNLRDKPNLDSDSNVVYALKYGEIITRTGIGDNGWSRVKYEGKILYAVTSYLTTDLKYQDNTKPTVDNTMPTVDNPETGIVFTEVNEKVTAKIITNLRLVPSSDSEDTIVFSLTNGEIGIRTGIGDNGWSRVEYEGQTLYGLSSYLELVTEE